MDNASVSLCYPSHTEQKTPTLSMDLLLVLHQMLEGLDVFIVSIQATFKQHSVFIRMKYVL